MKLGFEYDGKNFHQCAETDEIKNRLCEEAGIRLIRILEMKKSDPIPSILSQLRDNHFIINEEQIDVAKDYTSKRFVSRERLLEICNSYDDYREFMKAEPKLIRLLIKIKF